MQIKFEGFEKKDEGKILNIRLKVGLRQSIKIGLGLGIGFALAALILFLVSLIFGVSILGAIF